MPAAFVIASVRLSRAAVRRERLAAVERLHTLLSGGVPAADALAAAAACRGPGARIMRSASRSVSRGLPLSRALAQSGCRLGSADLALVRAGERSGELARSLGLLRARLEHEDGARRGLGRALVYPAILLTSTLVVVASMSSYVLPSFVSLYGGAGADLPPLTAAMAAAGPAVARASAPLATTLAALAGTVALLRRRAPGCAVLLDSLHLRVPVLGRLVLVRERESLYGTLSVLSRAGLDIERALALAAPAIGNRAVAAAAQSTRRSLVRGAPFSEAVGRSRLDVDGFDAAVLRTAEMTGDYAGAFARLASAASEERHHRTAALVAVIEPLTTLVMALLIGVTVLALYQPVLGSSALLLGAGP